MNQHPCRHAVARRLRSDLALQLAFVLAVAAMAMLTQSAAAQRQFEELAKRALPADRDRTSVKLLGDVDGDGDLDLIVGNAIGPNRLYQHDGTGSFREATATRIPVAFDLSHAPVRGDGDGDLDLCVGNAGADAQGQPNCLYLNCSAPSAPQVARTERRASGSGPCFRAEEP